MGKYLERLDAYTRFGYSVEELKAPLAKLGSYILPLNGLPVPQCFAEGLRWLVGQLPQRGYAELAEKLGMLLKDFDGRISTNDQPIWACSTRWTWTPRDCEEYVPQPSHGACITAGTRPTA